jgi:type 1 glutamine amidotransferase
MDHPPRIVLAIAEPEYETGKTLPIFAAQVLHSAFGFEIVEVGEDPVAADRLAGFADELREADLLILSIRRRALHPTEMTALKQYLAAGRPLVGVRTANHAFAMRPGQSPPQGHLTWPEFDAQIIGGNYAGHHGHGPKTTITTAPQAVQHPIVQGVITPFVAHGSLYKVSPLRSGATPLLIGRIVGAEPEPVAWTHMHGRSRVFYTSLGHKYDFREPSFIALLRNAVLWALEHEPPADE